ncbi:MAG: transcriptional repressor LexA [Spirochaetes bacterium]|nr:transcriptional repressor LexA [Spirochaetota bacterium]
MSKGLTARQSEILQFIENFINENNYPPTIKEIGENFRISLKGGYDHIKALQKKKYITYESKKRRSIKLLVLTKKSIADNDADIYEIPLLGTVQAGLPILSYENLEGKIKITKDMFGKGELFGLKIRGDSMIDEGIIEGDTAIVKCINYFENGEIVVVDTGNGVTIKKVYREKDNLRLEAANKKYSPILTHNVRIIGKLIGLIRRYG